MSDLVSIIVPVYNVEKYLHRCMESLLKQTYENIEIILVDDGSSDHSGEICDYYASMDNRVKVFHKKNQGVSVARNRGLEFIKNKESRYIFFMDSDDTICENAIEECIRLLKEEQADIVIGGYTGIGIKGFVRWSIIPQSVSCYTGKELLKIKRQDISTCHVWTKLYKKELWDNLEFPIGKKYEDSWIMPEVLVKASKVVTYPRSIYNYYENEGSIMHSEMTVKEHQMKLELYLHLIDFYYKEKMYELMMDQIEYYCAYYYTYKSNGIVFEEEYHKEYKKIIKTIFHLRDVTLKRMIKFIIREILRGIKCHVRRK